MIQLFHLHKRYHDGQPALDDVSLQVEKGDFVFLTGPSGAGKSTLLRVLFGLERCDSGQIIIQNQNISRLGASSVPYLRRSIGFVFQDFSLLKRKNVFQNIAIAMRVTGAAESEIDKRVRAVLDAVGLAHQSALFPEMLSYGQQQRLCIARAVVNNPSILLADEPTGNLDQDLAFEILQLFKDLNTRGTTVLLATHNLELVRRFPRRVVSLRHGRIERDGAGL